MTEDPEERQGRRSALQLLYGNKRRWIYIGALIVALLALKALGVLD